MRNSIVSRPRPRELKQLCAICARVAISSSGSVPLRSFSNSATNSTEYDSGRTGQGLAPRGPARPTYSPVPPLTPVSIPTVTRRRWLSKSSRNPSSAAGAAKAAEEAEPPASRDERPEARAAAAAAQTLNGEPDYYALFPQTLPAGPPPAAPFAIDTRALRREFLQLQAAVHPDFHHDAAAPEVSSADATSNDANDANDTSPNTSNINSPRHHSTARRQAEAVSALINTAYKTLISPLQRAQYLLQRAHGLDLAGDEAAALARPDPALLGEVLSIREAIEDAGDDEAELEAIRAANDGRVAECEEALAAAFARSDVTAAVAETVRLKYWLNVRETLHNWEKGSPIVLQH